MAVDQALKKSRYLLDSYSKTADLWNQFIKTNKKSDLRPILTLLCETHTRLEKDGVFWSALNALPQQLEENRSEVQRILNDFDGLLEIEYQIAQRPEFKKSGISACATDLLLAVQSVANAAENYWPDSRTIELLRSLHAKMRKDICEAHKQIDVNFGKVIITTSKSIAVVAGATLTVLNLTSAMVVQPALASAVAGISLMVSQLPKTEP